MDFPRPSLTLVIDRTLYRPASDKSNFLSLVEAAIDGGINIVQLRARNAAPGDLGLYAVALRLRELTDGRALFVVTGDLELAEKSRADGLLLPERSYKPSEARDFLASQTARLVGAFARSVAGAGRAERGGADYVQVGPIFDRDAAPPAEGLSFVRKVKDAVQVPVVAFGGVRTAEHVADCLRAGADGVAVTDAVTGADDPRAAAHALRGALDGAWRALHAE